MKSILLIHTGGTIGSYCDLEVNARVQTAQTAELAGQYLISQFKNGTSVFKENKITVADFKSERTTLSESMTIDKLYEIINFIKKQDIDSYAGVIVLHGTDTLAYTAALFSFVFTDIRVPLFLVSGNRPPQDEKSNATANFTAAIELIYSGIAPNVYVTYRNSDGKMRLYLGSCIMQSGNFSDDFFSASSEKVFETSKENLSKILKKCVEFSENIKKTTLNFSGLSNKALLIKPYTNLDYSVFSHALREKAYLGVVHGTYHSGTVSLPGLVLLNEARKYEKKGAAAAAKQYKLMAEGEINSVYSFLHLSGLCEENNIPLFIAPSHLGRDQYETMNVIAEKTDAVLLNMTAEAAYAKLILALSSEMNKEQIFDFMTKSINNEIV